MNSFATFKLNSANTANRLPNNMVEPRLISMMFYYEMTSHSMIFEEEVTSSRLENMDGQQTICCITNGPNNEYTTYNIVL